MKAVNESWTAFTFAVIIFVFLCVYERCEEE